ncbi:MAG: ABC-type multidrug transport system, ATPase component [Myxococcaceae bacterium]|nr:ABC-type multidrug transport system, ATPase component [Myxococcaceae bacterium]
MTLNSELRPALCADALCVRFGDTLAVDHLSFQVERGALFGFLGPNGAGKSTTVSVLCTLRAPSAGRAEVAGFDVAKLPHEVRRRIGVLFQDPCVDDRLTGLENLKLHAMVYGVPRKERPRRLEEAVALTGLGDAIARSVRTYSGGMRRRLELARVLLHQPEVLFLDEPTGGLDPQTRRAFWAYLAELRRQRGTTVFLTTHYIEEVETADAVAIIDHGRVVAQGTPSELKADFARQHGAGDGSVPALEDVFVALTGGDIRDDEASGRDHARGAVLKRGRLR